jgi:hypothetical protein
MENVIIFVCNTGQQSGMKLLSWFLNVQIHFPLT